MTRTFFNLTAQDLMSREVLTIPQDASLDVATQMLAQAQIGGAPVVDGQGRCVGEFAATALAHRSQLEQRARRTAPAVPGCVCSDWEVVEHDRDALPPDAVSWYMKADPVLVQPSTPVGELARMMVEAHAHRLIVAGADGRPTGVVSATDVMAAVASAVLGPE